MKRLFLGVTILAGLWFSACTDEDRIHAGEDGEPFYSLPQGNHVYDKDIVEWFDKYGFYTLYDFSEKDLYWNDTEWEEFTLDGGGHLKGQKADTNYVGRQVELFKELCVKCYPDDFLRRGMPLKVLLCSELKTVHVGVYWDWELEELITEIIYTDAWGLKGYDYLAIDGGNAIMEGQNDSLVREFSLGCNSVFLRILGEKKILQDAPDAFFEVSSKYYGTAELKKDMLKCGVLSIDGCNPIREVAEFNDFLDYLALAGYPLKVLNGKPGESFDEYTYPSLRGVFNEDRDKDGLIRKKYDIIVEWLKTKDINMISLQDPQDVR